MLFALVSCVFWY